VYGKALVAVALVLFDSVSVSQLPQSSVPPHPSGMLLPQIGPIALQLLGAHTH
jgi:hypothetical protein